MTELYADTPPTEAGDYYLRSDTGQEFIARRTHGGEWDIEAPDDLWPEWYVKAHYQFGPRVPTPAELADLKRDAERFRTVRDAAWWDEERDGWSLSFDKTTSLNASNFTDAVDAAKETP